MTSARRNPTFTSDSPARGRFVSGGIQDSSASPGPEFWSLSVDRIFDDQGLRLDAAYHNPSGVAATLKRLRDSGFDLKPLNSLAEIRLPGRFERIWARDRSHGVPYLNATDLLTLFSSGRPSQGMRYLSPVSNVNISSLIVRKNMLLVTCSGTIGRIYHVPERLDGWAATHDLIRVIPRPGLAGYLYAWCSSPPAQVQVLNPTHGAQIDHITGEQLGSILVPLLSPERVKRINRVVLSALTSRDRALIRTMDAWRSIV